VFAAAQTQKSRLTTVCSRLGDAPGVFSQSRRDIIHPTTEAAMIACLSGRSDRAHFSPGVRRVVRRHAWTALSWLLLASVAPLSGEAQGAATAASARPLLQLGVGDVINVLVYDRPELTTTTYIADDGSITMPLAGPVPIAGLSPAAAAQAVAAAYSKAQLLRNPQITVLLMQSRSQQVSVLGEVRAPGRFPVDSTMSVLDLLAAAGGTTETSADTVFVIRPDAAGSLERHAVSLRGLEDGRQSLQFLVLRGGDTVFVPPADQFYIYGEVQAPNMYRLEPEMTVLQAISRSGGLTALATTRRIDVKRRAADGTVVEGKVTLADRVHPDDVIHIREGRF
jgi:polysaccharide export outer membrane protein